MDKEMKELPRKWYDWWTGFAGKWQGITILALIVVVCMYAWLG